jgi:hypothetical protein
MDIIIESTGRWIVRCGDSGRSAETLASAMLLIQKEGRKGHGA